MSYLVISKVIMTYCLNNIANKINSKITK